MTRREPGPLLAFWALLALGLALRLYQIAAPLTDHHYWRQTDTAAIARNFAAENMNIFYPMLDWQGREGYAEVEFQLYTWLVAVLYRIFGAHDALGRLVSVGFSLATLLLLYDFARRLLGRGAALWAMGLYAVAPLPVFFGRSFQPESAVAFFSLLAIAAAWRAVEERREALFWLAAAATALALLLKLPSLYLGLPLAALAWRRDGARFLLSPRWWAFALIALLPAALWYAWAHRLGAQSAAGFSILGSDGTHRLFPFPLYSTAHFWLTLLRRWMLDSLALLAVPFAALGAWTLLPRKSLAWLWAWLLGFLLYQFGAALGHLTHDYYSLPLVLPLALCFGAGGAWTAARLPDLFCRRDRTAPERRLADDLAGVGQRYFTSAVCLVGIGGLAAFSFAYMHRAADPWYGELYALRSEAQCLGAILPPGSLVAINDDLEHRPEPFYFSRLQGWHETNFIEWQADLREWIERAREAGARGYAAFLEAEGNNPLYFLYAHPTGRYVHRRFPLLGVEPRLVVADLSRSLAQGRTLDLLPDEASVAWLSATTALHVPEAWTATRLAEAPRYAAFDLLDASRLRESGQVSELLADDSGYGYAFARDGIVALERGASPRRNARLRRALAGAEVFEVGRLPCYTGRAIFDIESPLLYAWQARAEADEFQDLGVLRCHELAPGRYTATYLVRCGSPELPEIVASVVLQTQPDRTLLSGTDFSGREWSSATEYVRLSHTFDYAGGASPEIVLQFRGRADLLAHSLLFHPALPREPREFRFQADRLRPLAGRHDRRGGLAGVGRGGREGRLFSQLLRLPAGDYRIRLDWGCEDAPPGTLARMELWQGWERLAFAPLTREGEAVFHLPATGNYHLALWDYGMAPLAIRGLDIECDP